MVHLNTKNVLAVNDFSLRIDNMSETPKEYQEAVKELKEFKLRLAFLGYRLLVEVRTHAHGAPDIDFIEINENHIRKFQ